MDGQVIGVNAQIDTGNTGQQGNVGIGFAIPSNTVQTVIGQILKTGHAQHPFLGIEPETITPVLARILHLPVVTGLIVAKVDPGTGAAKAGIKGGTTQVTVAGESYVVGGDVIARVNGESVGSLSVLRDLVAAKKPGQSMTLSVYRSRTANRGWKLMTVKVRLGQQPG